MAQGIPPASQELLETVARITELRDRDSLGVSLVTSLHELIDTRQIKLYKLLTDRQGRRLLQMVAQLRDDELLALESGGRRVFLEHKPDHLDCIRSDAMRQSGDLRLYPVHDGKDQVCGLLEIKLGAAGESEERLIAAFLRIYRNYLAILDDSERDTLTGLYTRKKLEQKLSELLAGRMSGHNRERDMDTGDFLAVLDIDHFKRINDNYGHLIGDEVLITFAGLVRNALRDVDWVFRYGGEEFVVLIKGVLPEVIVTILERIRTRVQDHLFPQVGQVTVSIGYTPIVSQALPPYVFEEADKALYYAKEHGRNQVCNYSELVSSGELAQEERASGSIDLF